jgi:hypothetical protein
VLFSLTVHSVILISSVRHPITHHHRAVLTNHELCHLDFQPLLHDVPHRPQARSQTYPCI